MKKCLNCQKTFKELKEINANLGFVKIVQKQCPHCSAPVDTEFIDNGKEL